MNINKETKKFNDSLIALVNNSGLPASNIYYVIKDIFHTVENIYEETCMKETCEQDTEIEE